MISTPLLDQIFESGEANRPVRRRAVETQPVSPARASDPTTSHEAANVPADIRGAQRVCVYLYLLSCGARGVTDYEISVACGILRTSAGKRRKELQDLGYVVDSGMRRQTDSNVTAIVWKVK